MRDRYGFKPDNLRNIIEKRGVNLSQIERGALYEKCGSFGELFCCIGRLYYR